LGSTTSALSVYSQEILEALQLPEQPLNSLEIPGYCTTKWGTLLRLDRGKSQQALSYLCVDQPADCSVPLLVNLGANVFVIFAWSQSAKEPLRIGLCSHWAEDLALKDLARWLRSVLPRQKATSS
jgi:hypothetical protein